MEQVHPISAQGGNSAIETAVVLANHLKNRTGRLSRGETLSEDALERLFANFQEQRFRRVVAAMEQGRRTTSVSIKDTLISRLFVDHFFARFGQGLIYRLIIKNTDTAPLIEGIPTPKRHLDANLAHLASNSGNVNWRMWGVGLLSAGLFAIYVYFHLR
jgi:2-polyprenyl-6-methoxyphenol hydroxylase-like FAD-dependent oxidoreductase